MSEYTQRSFAGGMKLRTHDTHLAENEYRIGFNLRCRYDTLDPVFSSVEDYAVPAGIKQALITFGNYLIIFVAGEAFYRYYSDTGWTQIAGFYMSPDAPRYWTEEVPIALTNYLRLCGQSENLDTATISDDPRATIRLNSIAAATGGNFPGLIVQDNINQPCFIFLGGPSLTPQVRTLQTFAQWDPTVDSEGNDKREYVPIGNAMAWVDGVLYIAAQNGISILRSVSGRPLDFVVSVDSDGNALGDAFTTAYSVGVGGITTLRQLSDGSLFVGAGNANFSVKKNMTENSPKIFGEYTFIRTFLFNATCLSDRAIFDTLGDTRFVDLTGVRSFNAVIQAQNEGRNTAFTADIQGAFEQRVGNKIIPIIQDATLSACILYDNYELYAVNTVFGAAIAVYDTLTQKWNSFDLNQTNGSRIKILAKIELSIQRLYAVTEDNKLFELYGSTNNDTAQVRTASACPSTLVNEAGFTNSTGELKLSNVRLVFDRTTDNNTVSVQPYINNKIADALQTKQLLQDAVDDAISNRELSDVDTGLPNLLFSFPNAKQGWKSYCNVSWTNGSLVQLSNKFIDITPMNPMLSQT